jgi:hypothetical protein
MSHVLKRPDKQVCESEFEIAVWEEQHGGKGEMRIPQTTKLKSVQRAIAQKTSLPGSRADCSNVAAADSRSNDERTDPSISLGA